tara:strand:+ start:129 stop:395 length:267 start_codon:yes stop_codon:yes gene_type:complete
MLFWFLAGNLISCLTILCLNRFAPKIPNNWITKHQTSEERTERSLWEAWDNGINAQNEDEEEWEWLWNADRSMVLYPAPEVNWGRDGF